ncbi:hypothetical protein GALMADRAFT_222840 [Galerina marginata CBS 339.88]|uniref:Uncharacterized protein n=1 Tax=Galerina marginata (strain CBS 339.88) TaxID=685588 RepID=A0A067TC36_GALM3|nr:hypothetical protein GALMADRAFT_222840 [Galerina marginata CBS 339.88]
MPYSTTSRERRLLEEIERLKIQQVHAQEEHKKVEENLMEKIEEMKEEWLIDECYLKMQIEDVNDLQHEIIREMDLEREKVERRVKGLKKENAKLLKQLNANMSLLSTQETTIDKLEAEISEMKGKEKRRRQVEYDDAQLSIAKFVKEAGRGQSKEALIKRLVGQLLEMEKDEAEKDGEIRELREELAGLEEELDEKDYAVSRMKARMKARMKETRDEWLKREAEIKQLIIDHVWLMLRNLVDSVQVKLAHQYSSILVSTGFST